MNRSILFDYPNYLQKIFDKLDKNGVKPILVGGYVRDKFLNLDSKDIDIELYGLSSYESLEEILEEFGNLNTVGKCFGVCKLSIKDLDLDFSLPRSDNKVSSGHCGFDITIDTNLDFKTASSRRDFTINAIGFNPKTKEILDPFNGIKDIENKILCAVDIEKFAQDPLRVLRLVGFAARFHFKIEDKLFLLCKKMSQEEVLKELPKERIYTEVKKILLKSSKPSIAFILLNELTALKYLHPLETLNANDLNVVLNALDSFVENKTQDKKTNLILMLSLLCYKFTQIQNLVFITNLTNDKDILKNVLALLANNFKFQYSDSQLLKLAIKISIENFLLFSQAIHSQVDPSIFNDLKKRAKNLGVLHKGAKAYLQGRDLIECGLKPSKEFSTVLSLAYEAQLNLEIHSLEEAKEWLQHYLKSQ